MVKRLEIFFSNRLEILYQQLKSSLFSPSATPLMRRFVVVYGPAMKNWLMTRMARDPDLNVAMGIEFVYLGQAFEFLLQRSIGQSAKSFPSTLELSFAIEAELHAMIQNYDTLNNEEQRDWEPILHYLKLKPLQQIILSRKMERRLIGLSEQLARLFQDYGRFASNMTAEWEKADAEGWQSLLWRKLFVEKDHWGYPCRDLKKELIPENFSLTLFSISFLSAMEFEFLNCLARKVQVEYYLLSPCAVFWSDIRSDREKARLENYWQRKLGKNSAQLNSLEELLRDRNPLLANFGRLGREMACQIEESQANTTALYAFPDNIRELHKDLFIQDDLLLTETEAPLSLLNALQADLLLMRNPQEEAPFNIEHEDNSIQLHVAPCRRREVEILYHNLLKLCSENPSLFPGDVIVMAPQIEEYVPYIQSIFGGEQSQLDFQLLDVGMMKQSEILQGFLLLINLSSGRWDTNEMLELFGHASFQRCHELTPGDCAVIQDWIEESGIRWGDDWLHRNELLQQRHCRQGMVENTKIGTWDYGLSRLILSLASAQDSLFGIPLSSSIEFSDSILLGKWVRLLHALRDDLSPLNDGSRMTITDWANYLICLLENYFKPDLEVHQSVEEYEELKKQLAILRSSSSFIPNVCLTFSSIKARLVALFENRGMIHREDRLHAVHFCSLMPLRSIPAQVIALMGMQEEAFPRIAMPFSLNQMNDIEMCDYCPSSSDFDRYLFLEALHSARQYLLLSYCGFSQKDSKELNPSVVVDELFSYLNQFYLIQGKQIADTCLFKHPFDAFDPVYFIPGTRVNNFSQSDFHAARALIKSDRAKPFQFVAQFECINALPQEFLPSSTSLDVKYLSAAARDPIKFHFNKKLEIYLESAKDRLIKCEEELIVSGLDYHHLKQEVIRSPILDVLSKAEREGKLPFGMFKDVSQRQLMHEMKKIQEDLEKHSLCSSDIFDIEFSAECVEPHRNENGRWILPPALLSYEDGYQLSIVGTLPLATSKGLLSLGKDSLQEIWKIWPQFLLYCCAARALPDHLQANLIVIQAAAPKKAFFEDPDPYLKDYLCYYAACLRNFSPLLPDLVPFFLKKDAEGLHEKLSNLISDNSRFYKSPYFRYVFNNPSLYLAEQMIVSWQEQADILIRDAMKVWMTSKRQGIAT